MRVFIILCALLGPALAMPQNPNRIVGGSPTNIQTYPYMSNMQFRVFGIFWSQACGGSLLTPAAVLSAAHCFYGDLPSQWRVILGSSLSNNGGTTHAVSQLVLHPQYSHAVLENDVAIVRLNNAAVYSINVQPARIAGANYNLADGTTVTHIGWGTLWSNGPSSQQLMHVDVEIINQKLCAERYAYLKNQPGFGGWPDVTDNMLCAGILDVGGKDACQGDSGGPLAHNKDVIVGVTSWGFECAHPFYPGVNARISRYTSWITATVNL
ncbi:trypsin, alkaline C [Spodoptera frugiperda]|uniref:trypsin n=1 Tax=Spodoptera frugiperda TaxID=7108 RepID=A0A9R0CYL2_SPOFR|nr:trypsin, alkaline C [Spodoptera frugiperda]